MVKIGRVLDALPDASRDAPSALSDVLPAGMPPRSPRPPAPAAAGSGRSVMYVGQFWAWKGLDVLLQAMSSLPPDVHLDVVGGDPRGRRREDLAAIAQRFGQRARVRYHGFVPHAQVHEELGRADCLVLPNQRTVRSGFFTSPMKLFEYMASGVPIVATDLPAIREVLRHEENALLVDPDRPEALANGIRRVLEDHALGQRLAARALEDVATYSWASRARQLADFLATVLDRRDARARPDGSRMHRAVSAGARGRRSSS
jgi:glycosyltransferase involved in cell wall biosynthesis